MQIIELFEKYDPNITGLVSLADVRSMDLYRVFHSTHSQIQKAEAWLKDKSNLNGLNHQFLLPDFIKYCSIVVHPLMKDNIFKRILFTTFGVGNYRSLRNKKAIDSNKLPKSGGAHLAKSNNNTDEHKLEQIKEESDEIDEFNVLEDK